jgi:hypothetical protein
LKGHRVCVLEAGKLQDRGQEWNISMDELLDLMKLGVLTQEDVDEAITTEFRTGFKNREVTPTNGEYFANGAGSECDIPDVLNLGVAPAVLLERVAARFKKLSGVIKEETRLKGVVVSEMIGTAMDLGDENEPVTAWLVLNCMSNGSPIYLQQRCGMPPDGVFVGSRAAGFEKESSVMKDVIYTNTEMENGMKQFVNRLLAIDFEGFVADPTFAPQIVAQVGIQTLVEFIDHVGMMGFYGLLDTAVAPVAIHIVDNMTDPLARFDWRRRFQAWKIKSYRMEH